MEDIPGDMAVTAEVGEDMEEEDMEDMEVTRIDCESLMILIFNFCLLQATEDGAVGAMEAIITGKISEIFSTLEKRIKQFRTNLNFVIADTDIGDR